VTDEVFATDSPQPSTTESAAGLPRRGPGRALLAAIAFLIPVSAALVVVFVVAGGSDERVPTVAGVVHTFEVPPGTADLQERGLLTDDVFPEAYTVKVGDTITVVNNDSEIHTFGPFTVRPGETQSLTFTEPGYFFGVCTAGPHETVTITVV
jgi:hypothetical protein